MRIMVTGAKDRDAGGAVSAAKRRFALSRFHGHKRKIEAGVSDGVSSRGDEKFGPKATSSFGAEPWCAGAERSDWSEMLVARSLQATRLRASGGARPATHG